MIPRNSGSPGPNPKATAPQDRPARILPAPVSPAGTRASAAVETPGGPSERRAQVRRRGFGHAKRPSEMPRHSMPPLRDHSFRERSVSARKKGVVPREALPYDCFPLAPGKKRRRVLNWSAKPAGVCFGRPDALGGEDPCKPEQFVPHLRF